MLALCIGYGLKQQNEWGGVRMKGHLLLALPAPLSTCWTWVHGPFSTHLPMQAACAPALHCNKHGSKCCRQSSSRPGYSRIPQYVVMPPKVGSTVAAPAPESCKPKRATYAADLRSYNGVRGSFFPSFLSTGCTAPVSLTSLLQLTI